MAIAPTDDSVEGLEVGLGFHPSRKGREPDFEVEGRSPFAGMHITLALSFTSSAVGDEPGLQSHLPMIAEYSDKTPHARPLSHWGEGCRRRGEGLVSIEEKHRKCHYNLQPSII